MLKIQFPNTKRINRHRSKRKRFPPKHRGSGKSWTRCWQYYKWRLLRLKEHPQKIARGFAAGVFAGCFPLMGLQYLCSFMVAILIRGNKLAAFMGTWISNPFTYVPLFFLNFHVGKLIMSLFIDNQDIQFSFDSVQNLTNLGQEITIALLLGSVIIGLFSSFVAYYSILFLLKKWQKN